MDLNHLLLFLALTTPLLVLARAWRPGGIFRGWRIPAIVVLAITGLTWLFFREYAGYVGGGAWFVLLFLPMLGLRRASQLAAEGRYAKAIRLARALQVLHPTAQLREQVDIFRQLQARNLPAPEMVSESLPDSIFRRLRSAPAVITIILLNIGVYLIELHREALNNPDALHRLGALDFAAVVSKGEFWRLFAALFLHYSPVHLIFNLLALYIIGPPLEKIIGTIRFAGCYLIAGVGSTAGVVLLTLAKIVRPAILVGASGCIMGIVGVWAGFLVRHRHTWQARQRLLNILMIIVIQFVFDLLTPQVSTSAHLCGLITGFALGLAVRPKRDAF
ncbi:MAG TPA: rhomboid family intramembrane serine protease [Chthoniobacterales bacterium]|nr:rhomboid family intramembrane serine protease [Chthoniobacterales bacterium]